MNRRLLVAALLAVCAGGSFADRRLEAVAERRQIFRDEVENIKAPLHPIEHNQNDQYYDGKPVYDDYAPQYQDDYRPPYQDDYGRPPYSQHNDYVTNDGYDGYPAPPAYQNDDYYKPQDQQYDDKPTYQDDYDAPPVKPDYNKRPSKPTYSDYRPSDEFRPFDESYFESFKPAYDNDELSYPQYGPMDFDLNFNGGPQKPSYSPEPYPQKPYRPSYQEEYDTYEPAKPAKPYKPYKPPPSYPKEVILLQPSAALKPTAYTDKYVTAGYKPSSVPGTPGRDYPNYSSVPETSFDCLAFKSIDYGYMYPDKEAGCQVFHACHADGRQDSFLCPLGTIFDLDTQTCDWWYNVRCY